MDKVQHGVAAGPVRHRAANHVVAWSWSLCGSGSEPVFSTGWKNRFILPFASALILLVSAGQAQAGGWASIESGSNPTGVYLGDTPTMGTLWVDQQENSNNRTQIQVYADQDRNLSSGASTGAILGGSGSQTITTLQGPQATATGTWWWGIRVQYTFGGGNYDAWAWTTGWSKMSFAGFPNNSTTIPNSYTVSALGNPTGQSANPAGPTSVNLAWTKWSGRNVMVVRSTASTFTAPTQGSGYSTGNTIGSGTVVYNGSGTAHTDTGLTVDTTYYYQFYSENYSYYSSGAGANATPANPTWDGGGANNNWGTADNWNPNVAPTPGTSSDIRFAGATRLTPFNDYTAYDDFRNITFNSGASSFTNTGNSIDWYGDIENLSANAQTLNLDNLSMKKSGGGALRATSGDLTVAGGGSIFNDNHEILNIYGNGGHTVTLGKTLVGNSSAGITIHDVTTLEVTAEQTYTGPTAVEGGGTLEIDMASGDPFDSSGITVGAASEAGYLHLNSSSGYTLDTPITLTGGNFDARVRNLSGNNTLSGGITLTSSGDFTWKKVEATGGSLTIATGGINLNGSNRTLEFSNTVPITVSSVISGGDNAITKNGSGTLTLSGNNTFTRGTGTIYIYGGTVELQHANAGGGADLYLGLTTAGPYDANLSLDAAITVANDVIVRSGSATKIIEASLSSGTATLSGNVTLQDEAEFLTDSGGNLTISGVISSSGATQHLIKEGGDTLTLSGNNTFTSQIYLNAGVLSVASINSTASAAQPLGSKTTNPGIRLGSSGASGADRGTLRYTGAASTTLPKPIRLTESSQGGIEVTDSGADLTISGVISIGNTSAGLYKTGDGRVILSAANTYDGQTLIQAGAVRATHADAFGDSSDSDNHAVIVSSGAAMELAGGITLNNGRVYLNGSGISSGGALRNISGNNTFPGRLYMNGASTIASDSGTLTFNHGTHTLSDAYALTVSGAGTVNFNIPLNTGANTLTKAGSGTLDMQNTSTYSGATTVSAGTLIVSGSSANSAHTVASGATLRGAGTVDALTISGSVDPANAVDTVGTLTTDNVNLETGGTMVVDITNVAGTPGTEWDLIDAGADTITVNATSVDPFTIELKGNPTGWNNSSSYSWRIIDAASVSGYVANKFDFDTTGFSPALGGGSFSVTSSGGDLFLVFTPAAPAAPDNLTASDGSSTAHVALSWDDVSGETGFVIWRNTADNFGASSAIFTNAANATTHNDTAATPGQLYYYWVTATNTGGSSGPSDNDTGYRKLATVTSVTASDGSSTAHVALSWDDSTGETGYGIWRHTADVSGSATYLTSVAANTTTHNDTTADPGQLYYYWVRATNSTSESQSDFSASDDGFRKLATVGGVTASVDTFSDRVRIEWTDITGETGYGLYRHTADNSGSATYLASVGAGVELYDDMTPTAGVDYYYWVRATNSTSESQSDFQGSGTLGRRATVAPPTVSTPTKATITSTSAVLGATIDSDGGAAITSRGTVWNTTGTPVTENALAEGGTAVGAFTHTRTVLPPGTLIYYRGYAVNSEGTGYSTMDSFWTVPESPVPDVAIEIKGKTFIARWANPTGATNVLLDVSTSSGFASFVDGYNARFLATATSHTVTGLTENTTYYWRLRAQTPGGTSSNSVSETTLTAPLAPVATAATSRDVTSFTANWNAAAGATSYRVDVSTNSAFETIDVVDDFDDGDFTVDPVWSGDTGSFSALIAATLPNGSASTDLDYLGSDASVGNAILTTPSTVVDEWRFSLGSTDFSPSSANHLGVVLMSDTAITGDITSANFLGYYLRLGVNGGTDYLELWRSTGVGKVKVGDFVEAGNYDANALRDGLNLRIIRDSDGVFTLYYSSGFTYASTPTTYGGRLTNDVYDTSSYFGVYARFGSPDATRRVYIDNILLKDYDMVAGYNDRSEAGTSVSVTSLTAGHAYYYRVRARNTDGTDSTNSNIITTYTLSTEPTAHATAFTAAPASTTSIDLSWTAAAGPPSGYLILQRTGADPTGTPADGQAYSVSDSIGDGTVAAIVTPGSATSATISGLSAGTTYHFAIVPYNWNGTNDETYNYRTASYPTANASTVFAEPGTQASTITFSAVGTSGMTVNWSNGNGANRIVVARAGSAVNANPADQSGYTANAAFGSGDEIGTGNFVVYSGSGSSVAVTGLSADTIYHFRVYEFNGSGASANYNVNTASGNPASRTTMANEPTVNASSASITAITTSGFTVNWTAGNGANSIVLIKSAAAVDSNPVDQTTYTANSAFGSGSELGTGNFVVYKGAGTSVAVSGLSAGTVYHVAVYTFNGSEDGAENYLTTGPATANATTLTAQPTTQAHTLTFPSRTKSSIQVNWTSGNGANRIVVAREGAAVSDLPVDGTGYSANAEYGSGDALGTGFVVYNGSGNSVTVTGLDTNTTYHFRVFEYNGSGSTANYFTDTASGNPASHATADDEPGIGLNPTTLTPSAVVGTDPASATFVVTNVGGSSLSYNVTDNVTWLSVAPGSGSSIASAGTQSHTITYDVTGLGPGTHNATITVTGTGTGENAATNSPRTIPVTLTLTAIPNPSAATATASGNEFVRLDWTKNASHDVLIVHREGAASTAPTQGTAYNLGDPVGSGTVIYKGSGSSLDHEVASDETHYYAFYSINNDHYSSGLTDDGTVGAYLAGEIFEPFAYTNSLTFDNKDGGVGWTNTWDVTSYGGATWSVITGTDTSDSKPIFLDAPSNQAAVISGNRVFLDAQGASRGGDATRGITGVSTGSIYVASMVAARYGGDGANRWLTLALMNGATEELEFGKVFGADNILSIRRSGSNASSSYNLNNYGAGTNNWYWIVLKYDFDNDRARVWGFNRNLNIPASEPAGQDADWSSLSISQVDGIRLKAGSDTHWIGGALFDEVRVARTWNELIGVATTDPALYVGPTNISLSVMKGSFASATFAVTNLGTEVLYYTNSWTVTYGSGSASVGIAPTSGTVNGNSTQINTGTVFGMTVGTSFATNRIAGNQTNEDAVVSFAVTVTNIPAPTALSATDDGEELVRLSWSSGLNVMVVYNEGSDLSGTPTDNTTYNVGDSVVGGTVTYKGSAGSLEHVVSDGATHYYRVYAINNNYYSDFASASATTVAYGDEIIEPFAYTNGVSLASLNGGDGWSGGWTVATGTFTIVDSDSAPAFPNISIYPDRAANRVRFSDPGNGSQVYAMRSFPAVDSGFIYAAAVMSYQYQGTEKWFGLSLMSNNVEKTFAGKLFDATDTSIFGVNGPNITKTKSVQNLSPYDGSGNTGNVYVVILRYNFSTREIAALRYHRTETIPESEPGTWAASVTAPVGEINSVDGIRISGGSGDAFNTLGQGFFDEIRVATTWGDLFGLAGVVATNYQIGNVTNYVFDGQVSAGSFPVVVNLRSESGVETVNTTPPYFIPNYDIFNTDGVEIVTDAVFSAFAFQDSGKTVIASNSSHAAAAQAGVVLGVYTGRWSAIASNGLSAVNISALSNGTPITFTVVDDDTAAPLITTIQSTNSSAFRNMHVSIGPDSVAGPGTGTNVAYTVTDAQLANIGNTTNPLVFWFGARDAGSGLNRGNADPAVDSHLSIGSAIISNVVNWDSFRSSPFTNTYSANSTNVWSWITPLSSTEIDNLVTNATYGTGTNPVRVTWRDADFDRTGDQLSLVDQQHGFLIVNDDDTTGPETQDFNIFGAEGDFMVTQSELLSGVGWSITGRVRDVGSGINVNGTSTTQPNSSPYFELWDSGGTMRLRQVFNSIPFGNGGATTLTIIESTGNDTLASAPLGVWTARVVVADADNDRTNDRTFTTNSFTFEVVVGDSQSGMSFAPNTLNVTSTFGVVAGDTIWPDLFVTNVGIGALIYDANVTYTGASGWLDVDPPSGNVGTGADEQHLLTVDTSSLNPGSYSATIHLEGNQTNGTQTVTVNLTVFGYYVNEIVDQFTNAAAGSLDTSTGGFGWTDDWNVTSGSGTFNSGNLSTPINYPAASGNKVCADTATEFVAFRNFSAFATGKVFAAVAFQRTTDTSAGYAGLSFMNNGNEVAFAGKPFGGLDFGIDGTNGVSSGGFSIYNSVYFMVLMYDFDTRTMRGLIRNPGDTLPLTEPGTWNATQSGYDIDQITGIRLAGSSVGTLCFDELRVASTWENLLNEFTSEPTLHATSLNFRDITTSSMQVGWTPGNGAARIVVARQGSAVDFVPTDGNSYAANPDFSVATDLGSGNKVVFNGSGTNINVTGLSAETQYYFAIYEYSGSGASTDYLTSGTPLNGNRWTLSTEPAEAPTDFAATPYSDTAISNTWTQAGGSPAANGYIILRRQGSAVNDLPVDGAAYSNGDVIGDSIVSIVTPGSAEDLAHTGLTTCNEYHFRIFSFRWDGANAQTRNYYTNSSGTAFAETECVAPDTQASNIVFSAIGTNRITATWSSGSGDGRIVVVRGTNAVNQVPVDGTTYTASANFGSGSDLGSGNYVVYSGTNGTVTVSNLVPGVTYSFHVFEFNGAGSGIDYNVTTANNNPRSVDTASFGLVEDKFDYGAGNMFGANGGTGWTNSWGTLSGQMDVANGNFGAFGAYPEDAGTRQGFLNSVTKRSAHRNFPGRNSGEIYFAIKINIGTTVQDAYFGVNLLNGAASSGAGDNNVTGFFGKAFGVTGNKLSLDHNNTIRTNKLDGSNEGYTLSSGSGNDFLMVAVYDFDAQTFKARAYTDDQIAHADPNKENGWIVEMENVVIDNIDGIEIIGNGLGNCYFDHIRIAPSWEEVMWGLPAGHHDNGPVPTLAYIGTNYLAHDKSIIITNVSDAELRSATLLDFAVSWYHPDGVFITNSSSSVTNIGSPNGRVNPNWDPLAVGAATNAFNLDAIFENVAGYNGATSVTSYHYTAFNITNINFENEYFVTVSAESTPPGSGTVAAPNTGDPIPVERQITINHPLRFYVFDDDTNPPVRGASAMVVLTNATPAGSQPADDGTRRWFVLDGALGNTGMRISLNAFDDYSGIQRANVGDPATNMNLTVAGLAVSNIANYASSLSTANTIANSTATSVWEFANTMFDFNMVSDLWGGDGTSAAGQDLRVTATLPNADDDRVDDQEYTHDELFGFIRVIDDDAEPPTINQIAGFGQTLATHFFYAITNGSRLFDPVRGQGRVSGGHTATNSNWLITDNELMAAGTKQFGFAFGAVDQGSGLSRATSGSTNTVMSFSLGSYKSGVFNRYDATLSTANNAGQVLTNVFIMENADFTQSEVDDLLMAGNVPVTITVPDNDNDRNNDQSLLVSQPVGFINVVDDDVAPPLMDNLNINISSDHLLINMGFTAFHGWTNGTTSIGTHVSHIGGDVWSGQTFQVTAIPFYPNPSVDGGGRWVSGLRVGSFSDSTSFLVLPEREDLGTLFVWTRLSSQAGPRGLLLEGTTNGTDWVDYGTYQVTDSTNWHKVNWTIDHEGPMTLRLSRTGSDDQTLYLDDIVLTKRLNWTNENDVVITWDNAQDESAVWQYRRIDNEDSVYQRGTNFGQGTLLTTNTTTFSAGQGVVTGVIFAVDNDTDRTTDRLRSGGLPYVLRIDTNPPVQVSNARASDAVGGNLFDSTIDETSEIKVEWNVPAAEAEAAGWRQSDNATLSPWDSYLIEYYQIDDISGDSMANAITTSLSRTTSGWTNILHAHTFTNLVIDNLDFDSYYRVSIRGRDKAGNIGGGIIVTGNTDRFSVTQGVNRVELDLEVFWTGYTNRWYDVLRYDSAQGFRDSLTNAWQFMLLTNRPAMSDTGGVGRVRPGELTGNSYRFYRVARPGAWQATNTVRRASQEVYVTKALPLYPGENWHSLFFEPDTNTIAYVFGTNILEGGVDFAAAPKISWYNSEIVDGQVMNVSTMQVWLRDDNTWRFNPGDTLADTLPIPLWQTFNLELPTGSETQSLVLIGRVPTNDFVLPTLSGAVGATNYHLVSHRLPTRTRLDEMNFPGSGLKAAAFVPPFNNMPDEIRVLNNTPVGGFGLGSQQSPVRRYYMHSNGNFYRWQSTTLANADIIDPSDSLVIVQYNHAGTITWTNKMMYTPPTKNISP